MSVHAAAGLGVTRAPAAVADRFRRARPSFRRAIEARPALWRDAHPDRGRRREARLHPLTPYKAPIERTSARRASTSLIRRALWGHHTKARMSTPCGAVSRE